MLSSNTFRRLVSSLPLRAIAVRHNSRWAKVPMGPKDPILGVTEAFLADKHSSKLNLGVGAYRDDNNKPVVIKSVQEATKRIYESSLNNEYGPIAGPADFVQRAAKLAFGAENPALANKQVASIQTLSGTGALRLAGAFLNRFFNTTSNAKPVVYLPKPTWGTHVPIFNDAGLEVKEYRYYKPETKGLDLEGLLADLKAAPENAVFLFHACAHNPTGVDPSPEQWKQIADVVKAKGNFVIMDNAYQGFASGDPNKDAFAFRHFVSQGIQLAVCSSYAKNFGLYGQRVGLLSLVTSSEEETARVESQLKILARAMYSNPPIHGARVVSTILGDSQLTQQWEQDVKTMADRIISMRSLLRAELERLGSPFNWSHITSQIGMFCFSGLTPEQVDRLTNEYHIYLTRNGRISMAGVTTKDIPYLAKAIHEITTSKQ